MHLVFCCLVDPSALVAYSLVVYYSPVEEPPTQQFGVKRNLFPKIWVRFFSRRIDYFTVVGKILYNENCTNIPVDAKRRR